MLTKGKHSKFRAVKYVAMVLALVAVLAFTFTACGKGEALSAEYLAGTLEKSQYNPGETFDCTGAQMKVTYANGGVETVAITSDMVGNVVLSFGMSTVEATYSVDGKQIKCAIPVTVIDPLSNDKSAAISAINGKDAVKNGDKGVAAMVAEYTNKINAAATKDAITALSAAFETELNEYVAGKAAALARVNLTKDELVAKGLYEQFLLDVMHAQTLAIANIQAALSVAQADDLAAAFEDTIAKKLSEQAFYEGADDDAIGQIDQKIEIIKLINKYIGKAENYIALIKEFNPGNTTDVAKYNDAIDTLDLLKEEVRLAINLAGYKDAVENINETVLKTGVDEIYDLIDDGFTITPAPYGEDMKTLNTAEDATAKLILDYKAAYGRAVDVFGDEIAERLATEYKYGDSALNVIDLLALLEVIEAKKGEVDTKQAAIATLNAAVADWDEENAPAVATIVAAWAELRAWGTSAIAAIMPIDTAASAVVFIANDYAADSAEKILGAFEIKYVTEETEDGVAYDGIYAVNEWSGYYVDETYLLTYFFPALDNLIAANDAAIEAAEELATKAGALAPVVYTHDKAVDADNRIKLAENAYANFVAIYAPDAENDATMGAFLAELNTIITDARAAYDKLVADADALIALIEALPEADKVVIKDFDELDADLNKVGKLYKAYTAWLAFYEANSYTDGNNEKHHFIDVIDDGDNDTATTDDQYTDALLACMKAYVELKFTEEVKVYGNITVAKAYTQAIEETDDAIDTIFRYALTEKKAELLSNLPKFDASAYDEATLHNIADILAASLVESKAAAKALANQFVDFYNNHELKTDDMADLVAFQ